VAVRRVHAAGTALTLPAYIPVDTFEVTVADGLVRVILP
jgi:hypothetical protein